MNKQKNNVHNMLGLIVAMIMENKKVEDSQQTDGFPTKQEDAHPEDKQDKGSNVENLPNEHEQPDVLPLERENPETADTEEIIHEETPDIIKPEETPVPEEDEITSSSSTNTQEPQGHYVNKNGQLIKNSSESKEI